MKKTGTLAGSLFAFIAIVVLAAWLWDQQANRQGDYAPIAPAVRAEPKSLAAAPPTADPASASPVVAKQHPVPSPATVPVWQHRIDAVLESSASESQTALILLGMFGNFPPEGQGQAARHIANLLADADYEKVKPLLLNPGTNGEALEVFYADLMNRPDATKLHTLLDLAKIQNHPFSEEARGTLAVLLGEDNGSDWTKWNSAIDSYMADGSTR